MKKRILVVEDEVSILQLLTIILTRAGYEVHTCTSGREAIATMKKIRPHMVLLDVMLPGLDGKRIVSIMEQDEELNGIPVIITSALVESEKMFQHLPQVKAFCSKPFVIKDLLDKVKHFLGDD